MKCVFLILVTMLTGWCYAQSSKKVDYKNQFHLGVSGAYLPTWILDDFHGNALARVVILGINAHADIWKESVFKFGIGFGKMNGSETEARNGIILPLKLQKFFVPERKGFNLALGMVFNICKRCPEGFDGAFTNDISYLFSGRTWSINAGLQVMEGALFDEPAVQVGGHVELIYRPVKF